nr:TWiK family of potassium channels protein 18 isoform X2 [Onthophagus taurus]
MDSKSSTPITPPTPPRSEPGTPSILSRSSSRKNKRQIGWAPPPLKIPSPQGFLPPTPIPTSSRIPGSFTAYSTQGLSPNVAQNPYVYPRKYSEYMFNQFNGIKDFTIGTAKSGLGIGEKCSFWMYNKLSKLSRSWFTHIFLSIVIVLYTVGGAFMFLTVEGTNRKLQDGDLRKERYTAIDEIIKMVETIPHNTSPDELVGALSRRLDDYEVVIIDMYKQNTLLKDRTWTFWNAVFFCSTIYTTIGYGHMFPTTITGKGLTILYALIGIPLFLIILTDFGKLFTRCIKYVWAFVRRLYYTGRCRKVRKTAHVEDIFKGAQMVYEAATLRRPSKTPDPNIQMEEGTDDGGTSPATPAPSNYEIDDEFNLPITLALSILVLYIFLGAVGFQVLENWDFFSSFYFVFISLSTIGLGDFVPSNNLFMIFSIVYLVFGLALMSMCINVVQDKISDTFKRASAKIGATIGLTVNEEDGSIITVPPDQVEMPEVHNAENIQKDINKNNESKDDEIIMTKIK